MTDHDPRIQTPTLAELLIAANNADWGQVVCNGGPPCFHFDRERQRFCLAAERWAGHKQYHPFMNLADMVGNYLATVAAVTRDQPRDFSAEHQAVCEMLKAGDKVGLAAYVNRGNRERARQAVARRQQPAVEDSPDYVCGTCGGTKPTACRCEAVTRESVEGREGRIAPEHATALQIALLEQQARADKWELTCQAKDAQLTALQAEVEQLKRQREELSKAVDGVIVVERRPIGSATPVTPGHAVATRRSEAP